MKKTKSILAIALLTITTACGEKQSTDTIITVDVNGNYPEKELILQDFMDVEYIPLETSDEFITHGMVKAIGKNIIIVTNWGDSGDIFVFSRTGKGIRKINRQGQGDEEYLNPTSIVLDENNNEIFVQDYSARKINVYDLYGNYKRSFRFADTSYYEFVFDYDRDNLICYKSYPPSMETDQSYHLLISKQDGSITRRIGVPTEEIETPVFMLGEAVVRPSFELTIPSRDNWILMRPSSDTLYSHQQDGNIKPFIVRSPSIHSMETKVFLFTTMITDRYYFMQTLKKQFNMENGRGFPITELLYDKQENALFKSAVYNDDYTYKNKVSLTSNPVNHDIAVYQHLEAHKLVEDYQEGKLKGKLNDIAAELEEDSNPVIMLVKHKNR